MRVGSNWLSIDNPTLRSLKPVQDVGTPKTDLLPLYSMRRMIGRSVTKKNHDLGVGLIGRILDLKPDVFKILGIPQGGENRGEGHLRSTDRRHGKRCGARSVSVRILRLP